MCIVEERLGGGLIPSLEERSESNPLTLTSMLASSVLNVDMKTAILRSLLAVKIPYGAGVSSPDALMPQHLLSS